MDALLTMIVLWLSLNFDLPANYEHPRVEFVNVERMAKLRFPQFASGQDPAKTDGSGQGRSVVAVYAMLERTIYLPEGWTGRTPAESSMLVHEMVHHLQNLGGQRFSCPEERERTAYEAQEKWLNTMGRTIPSEFDLDRFTILVVTQCAR